MSALSDVAIISAFGRGNWLAAELSQMGLSTQLYDVSDSLGRWAPEDWEGPFGFFHPDWVQINQMDRLTAEDYHDQVANGFCVWVPEGPIDLRGMLAAHWEQSIPAVSILNKYLLFNDKSGAQRRAFMVKNLPLGFSGSWLVNLAHQLAATVYKENTLSSERGQPLPLNAPFFLRRNSRKGLNKSLDWCAEQGVKVQSDVKVKDVSIEGKSCVAVELGGGEIARVVRAENFIWCLSSHETRFVAPEAAAKLFPKGELKPEWSWMRWRIQGSLGAYTEVFPAHVVLISDLGLPWTHENLLILQRCEVEGSVDVWARIPDHHRFQKAYCEQFGEKIIAVLNKKIPEFGGKVQDYPQDYHYNIEEIGPSLFPVYAARARDEWGCRNLKNLYHASVEFFANHDWTGRFQQQMGIVQELASWQKVRDAKLAKLEKGAVSDKSL